jgi:hypothetical protein
MFLLFPCGGSVVPDNWGGGGEEGVMAGKTFIITESLYSYPYRLHNYHLSIICNPLYLIHNSINLYNMIVYSLIL